jgi:hypothetical protein
MLPIKSALVINVFLMTFVDLLLIAFSYSMVSFFFSFSGGFSGVTDGIFQETFCSF